MRVDIEEWKQEALTNDISEVREVMELAIMDTGSDPCTAQNIAYSLTCSPTEGVKTEST